MGKRRRTPEDRYTYNFRKQKKTLDEFAAHGIEWTEHLIHWYHILKKDMPDDEYRACAFFLNKEFSHKPGSLTLLYEAYVRWLNEMPRVTRENAFDLLSYQFKMYAKVLMTGGF